MRNCWQGYLFPRVRVFPSFINRFVFCHIQLSSKNKKNHNFFFNFCPKFVVLRVPSRCFDLGRRNNSHLRAEALMTVNEAASAPAGRAWRRFRRRRRRKQCHARQAHRRGSSFIDSTRRVVNKTQFTACLSSNPQ